MREVESGYGNPMTEFTGEEASAVFFSYSGRTDPGKDELGEHGGQISVWTVWIFPLSLAS
ncbi:MAG: hypothetical protein M3Z49_07870 [Bifidobacteriales bacterium]|nr:hypothetical protein [Bifidobacteriales bacterium]